MKFFLSVLGAFVLVVAWLAYDSQRAATGLWDITSKEPDGWYVLAELLRSEGYRVSQSRSIPVPSDDVLVVVPSIWLSGLDAYEPHPNRILVFPQGEQFVQTRSKSRNQTYNPESYSSSERQRERTIENAELEGVTFTVTGLGFGHSYDDSGSYGFNDGNTPYVYRAYKNWLEYTNVVDTTFTQNRWIAKNDNAAFALTIFRSNLEPGGRIVFVSGSNHGLLAVLGPWSRAALVLFFVLMGVFLVGSRRFAKAYPREPKVQSSKDLIFAMAAMLKQADHAGFALQRVLDYDLAELRRQLRLPTHVAEDVVLDQLPQEIKHGFIKARGSSAEKHPARVIRILKEWRKLLAQYQTGVR